MVVQHMKAKASTVKALCKQMCRGVVKEWEMKAVPMSEVGCRPAESNGVVEAKGEKTKPHKLARAGTLTWCRVCGGYAETKAVSLSRACRGAPPASLGSGALRQQLEALWAGTHPVSGVRLPASIGADGQEVLARGCYHRLKGRTEEADENFKPYVPAEFKPAEPKGGRLAYAKVALIAGRIRMQVAAKRRQQRLQRRVEVRESLDRLINTFGADGLSDDGAEGGKPRGSRWWDDYRRHC